MRPLTIITLIVLLIDLSQEHGMLMDPVNRSSMWRKGYKTPPNYDDDGLYCGEVMVSQKFHYCNSP
jgi:hypothetical protein